MPKLVVGENVVVPSGVGSSFWFWLKVLGDGSAGKSHSLLHAAVQAGAYGVHLGQEDLDLLQPVDLDAIRTAGLRLGVSTHGYAEMLRADSVSPSYIALGAVFPTTLKRMATAPQGTARLSAYARLLRNYPLVAIGGIDTERLPGVLASGVGSIGVVRALTAAPDPEQAALALGATIQKFLIPTQKP